jgi:transcriptional regulator GlxA family with amidase domain
LGTAESVGGTTSKVFVDLAILSGKLAKMEQDMTTIPVTHITFMLFDRMLATSSTLPMEMLLAAESRVQSLNPGERRQHLKITTAAVNTEPVTTRIGLRWQADQTLEEITRTDIIYIPGLWRNPRPIVKQHPQVTQWLREQYHNGAIISAVGTGCCFLAEAGLLDGKVATTHWHYFDQFQQDYPAVQLKRQYFITQAGNLYCAASVNSLADLTVHFIQRLFGKDIATKSASPMTAAVILKLRIIHTRMKR